MADNISILDSAGSAKVHGTDDISSVHYPRHKLIHGIDGVNDGDVARTNGFPIQVAKVVNYGSLSSQGHAFFTNSYQDFVVNGIANATELFINNETDGALLFSFDAGTTTHFRLKAGTSRVIKIKSGTTALHVKWEADPTSGSCFVEAYG